MKAIKFYIIIASFLSLSNSNAQTFYAKVFGGIGFSTSQGQNSYLYPLSFPDDIMLKDNITPIGTSGYWGGGIGYAFYKYFEVDLSVEYMSGYENGVINLNSYWTASETVQFSGKISTVFFIPNLVITSNNTKRFFGYLRLGPMLHSEYFKINDYTITDNTSFQLSTSAMIWHLEFSTAIGAEYSIKKYFHCFIEISPINSDDLFIHLLGVNAGLKYCFDK